MTGQPAVAFHDVGKTFTRGKSRVTALDGITTQVERGRIVAVIGFSGAGKSTLVRLINGLETPTRGHLEIDGHDAETRAADSVREREGLDLEEWAARLQVYYSRLEALLWPDLFVVGGGISKKADTFLPLLDLRTPVVAAKLKNKAGIIGAARLAAKGN
mgnify:CR=1 FL=1